MLLSTTTPTNRQIRCCSSEVLPELRSWTEWLLSMLLPQNDTRVWSRDGPGWSRCVLCLLKWLVLLFDLHGWDSWTSRHVFQVRSKLRCQVREVRIFK